MGPESVSPRRPRRGQRGFILISGYLVLTVLLVYLNTLTARTLVQRAAADRVREGFQALDLAQGAVEQLREDVFFFLTTAIPALISPGTGELLPVLRWFDNLATGTEDPPFDLDGDGTRDARTSDTARRIQLSPGAGTAWITSIVSTDAGQPLAPRLVTFQGTATVGGVTKTIQATYEITLGPSGIFRYAYFVNNYGWLNQEQDHRIDIRGEVRANGDLEFTGTNIGSFLRVLGDLYASVNPEVINPRTQDSSQGLITGYPGANVMDDYMGTGYWDATTDHRARPGSELVLPNQPPIRGSITTVPPGTGWDNIRDTDLDGAYEEPQPRRFEALPTHPMPYLGDMRVYERLAQALHGALSCTAAGCSTPSITEVHSGPSTTPVVLIGTQRNPIRVNGPVVVPGDVIIRGYVEGQGTIYAGRNVHIAGEIRYLTPPKWYRLERQTATGEIRAESCDTRAECGMGTIEADGTYTPPEPP